MTDELSRLEPEGDEPATVGHFVEIARHLPRCNFWCRNGWHHLLPADNGHTFQPASRIENDRCRICGGGFHQPTKPERKKDRMTITTCDCEHTPCEHSAQLPETDCNCVYSIGGSLVGICPGHKAIALLSKPLVCTNCEDGPLECDENNPECRCPECVNAGSDIADMG